MNTLSKRRHHTEGRGHSSSRPTQRSSHSGVARSSPEGARPSRVVHGPDGRRTSSCAGRNTPSNDDTTWEDAGITPPGQCNAPSTREELVRRRNDRVLRASYMVPTAEGRLHAPGGTLLRTTTPHGRTRASLLRTRATFPPHRRSSTLRAPGSASPERRTCSTRRKHIVRRLRRRRRASREHRHHARRKRHTIARAEECGHSISSP
jgi:hypothetical protein